jgi:hypothetical protein
MSPRWCAAEVTLPVLLEMVRMMGSQSRMMNAAWGLPDSLLIVVICVQGAEAPAHVEEGRRHAAQTEQSDDA